MKSTPGLVFLAQWTATITTHIRIERKVAIRDRNQQGTVVAPPTSSPRSYIVCTVHRNM